MSNDIQKEFEKLIKTLTTEISKEVLLDDMKNLRKSYTETHEKYNNTYKGYINEVEKMSKRVEDFRVYATNAQKHTDELKSLNTTHEKMVSKMNTVLKDVEESKQVVLSKILNDNAHLFEQYKKSVSKYNSEEEERFLGALKNELEYTAGTVSAINKDIKEVMVKIDYNQEKVLEDILVKNIGFNEAYQKNISDFNRKETKLFLDHVDKYVIGKLETTEKILSNQIGEYLGDIGLKLKNHNRDMINFSESIRKSIDQTSADLSNLKNNQLKAQEYMISYQEELLRTQRDFQKIVNEKIVEMITVNKANQSRITIENERNNNDVLRSVNAVRREMKTQSGIFFGVIIVAVFIFFASF